MYDARTGALLSKRPLHLPLFVPTEVQPLTDEDVQVHVDLSSCVGLQRVAAGVVDTAVRAAFKKHTELISSGGNREKKGEEDKGEPEIERFKEGEDENEDVAQLKGVSTDETRHLQPLFD